MRRQAGFTLVELMVVIAILGILGASAVPVFQTYRQRSYGSEANITMKRLLEGEIVYFLEKDEFFPKDGQEIVIKESDPQDHPNILALGEALKITIPVGHNLQYRFYSWVDPEHGLTCQIQISADFPLYKTGDKTLIGTVYQSGEIFLLSG